MSDSDAYSNLAERHKAERRREEELLARRRVLGVAESDGERAAALVNLADPLSYFGRTEEALDCLREAASLRPHESFYWLNLAAYLIREGRAVDGLEALGSIEEMAGQDAAYWMWVGRAKRLLGRQDEAVEAFRRSVALNPNAEHVWRDLAMALVEMGRYSEANEICEGRLRPGLVSHLIQADIESRKGDRTVACALVRQGLDAMSGPEAFEDVKWHYCNRQSHLDLIAFVRQLAAALPGCPWGHWILARLLSVLGDRSAATDEVSEMVRLTPGLAEAWKTDPYLRGILGLQL